MVYKKNLTNHILLLLKRVTSRKQVNSSKFTASQVDRMVMTTPRGKGGGRRGGGKRREGGRGRGRGRETGRMEGMKEGKGRREEKGEVK